MFVNAPGGSKNVLSSFGNSVFYLLSFWRTKNRQEVDHILEVDGELKPVENLYKKRLKSSDYKGLKSCQKAYPDCHQPFIVNLTSNSISNGVQNLSPFDGE